MSGVWGRAMKPVPPESWPLMLMAESRPLGVWRSNDYLAVLYRQRADGQRRLTVNSTRRKPVSVRRSRTGTDWRDGITWDELQRIKNECLGEDVWCVEVYPAQDALVDVYNQRHLWVLDGPPETRFPEEAVTSDAEIEAALALVRAMVGGRHG